MLPPFKVIPSEANHWWRNNDLTGAILNKLMVLFIVGPVVLVFYGFYILSFVVFAGMVPYGLILQRLACRAVKRHLDRSPEESGGFAETGVILRLE